MRATSVATHATDEARAANTANGRGKREAIARGVVLLAGGCLAIIGGAILCAPHAFHGLNDITLPSDASMLSEVRAPGAALLVIGVGVLLGAFRPRHLRASAALGAAVYLAYAGARALSIALDGVPHEGLLQALAIELVAGAACLTVADPGRGTVLAGKLPKPWSRHLSGVDPSPKLAERCQAEDSETSCASRNPRSGSPAPRSAST